MSRSLSLEDLMVKRPVKVKADTSILDAVETILSHSVSGVCVVDDTDQLVGVLSELDCLRAIVERIYIKGDTSAGYVYEIMTKEDLDSCKRTDDIVSVAASMLDNKRRRRPVVEDNKLVGQITCRQILGAIHEFSQPKK